MNRSEALTEDGLSALTGDLQLDESKSPDRAREKIENDKIRSPWWSALVASGNRPLGLEAPDRHFISEPIEKTTRRLWHV